MSNMFSIPILGAMAHSLKTKQILAPHVSNREQSEFIRMAIMRFADKQIKNNNNFSTEYVKKPKYIDSAIWQQINTLQQKSYRVNYLYAIAFFWLLSLPEFANYSKSKLMRTIIESEQL